VEASTAEAEAISAALAAAEAKSRDQNGEIEPHSPDRDRGADAAPSGKPPSSPSSATPTSLNRASMGSTPVHTPPTGVRLHHRAVSALFLVTNFDEHFFFGFFNVLCF
jgi:protein phosphatase